MTDHREIPCQIRDENNHYAYCYGSELDEHGRPKRSGTLRISYDPVKEHTSLQCKTNPKEHRFKIDREGNVVNE